MYISHSFPLSSDLADYILYFIQDYILLSLSELLVFPSHFAIKFDNSNSEVSAACVTEILLLEICDAHQRAVIET